jgi:hypothetical protein
MPRPPPLQLDTSASGSSAPRTTSRAATRQIAWPGSSPRNTAPSRSTSPVTVEGLDANAARWAEKALNEERNAALTEIAEAAFVFGLHLGAACQAGRLAGLARPRRKRVARKAA